MCQWAVAHHCSGYCQNIHSEVHITLVAFIQFVNLFCGMSHVLQYNKYPIVVGSRLDTHFEILYLGLLIVTMHAQVSENINTIFTR